MAVRASSVAAGGVSVLGTVIDPTGAKRGARETNDAIKSVGDTAKRSGREFEGATKGMGDSVVRLTRDIAKLAAAYLTFQSAIASGREIIRATQVIEGIDSALTTVTGSAAAAAEEIRFLRAESDRLGTVFEEGAASYTRLAAAAQGTALEGAAVRETFTAINEAAVVLNLTTDQTGGALTALEQIISKGVVSAEELRGQLGERIPGAFQIAARAVGVTTEELGKMLEQGQLLAEDFIPVFARQLREEMGDGVEDAATRAGASFNRLQNAIFDLAAAIGRSGLLDFLAATADLLTSLTKQVYEYGVALGVLEVNVRALSQSELAQRYTEESQRLLELNRLLDQYEQNLADVRAERARMGGDPLGEFSIVASPETVAAQRTGLGASAENLNRLIGESAGRLAEYAEAMQDAASAERRLNETQSRLNDSLATGERRIRDLGDAAEDTGVDIRGLAGDLEWLEGPLGPGGSFLDFENIESNVRENVDAHRAAAEEIQQTYVDMVGTVTGIFAELTSGATVSIEQMTRRVSALFQQTMRAMGDAAANNPALGLLGAGISGAAVGAGLGGWQGAIGGGLGAIGGTLLAPFLGPLAPLGGTIGSSIGGLIGSLFGRSEPHVPEAYFQQIAGPYGNLPQVATPFGHSIVNFWDSDIPAGFAQSMQEILNAVRDLDVVLSEALGPQRTAEIREALFGLIHGGDLDEWGVEQALRRRIEIIFETVGGTLEETFSGLSQGLDLARLSDLAVTLAEFWAAFEEGERVFSDIETPVETVNTLMADFVRQGETLAETLDRLGTSMGLVNALGLDHLENTTAFARMAEDFVAALGGMEAAQAQVGRFLGVFGATESGLRARAETTGAAAGTALGAIGLSFDQTAPMALDEFNRAFMDVQQSIGATDLALWVEAGLALADFTEVFNQLPVAVEDAADQISDVVDEITRDDAGIARILEPISRLARERGMSELEAALYRLNTANDTRLARLEEMGASEAELAFVRSEGELAVQALIDAEAERARLANEAQEARERENRRRILLGLEETPEGPDQARIRSVMRTIGNERAERDLPELEYQIRLTLQRFGDMRAELVLAGASQSQLTSVLIAQQEAVQALIDAETQRKQDLEDERKAGIEGILGGLAEERARREMSPLQLEVRSVVQRFGDLRVEMVRLGATSEQMAVVNKAQADAIQDVIDAENQRKQDLEDEREAGIEGILGGLADERARREMTPLQLEMRSVLERFGDLRAEMVRLGATSEQMAVVNKAQADAIQDVIDAEGDRNKLAAEQVAADISAIVDPAMTRLAQAGMSDLEIQIKAVEDALAADIAALEKLEASEEDMAVVREDARRTIDDLREAEAERTAAQIEAIMEGVDRAFEEIGLSDLELQILRIRRETDETVRSLMDLEAGAADVADAIALGERRIAEARRAALEQELAAIDAVSASIDSGLGGLIENIAASLRTDEENFDALTDRAEELARTIQAITDPDELARVTREIEQLTARAWGILSDPLQQQAAGKDFIGFLEQIRELTRGQFADIRQTAIDQAGIQQAFTDALFQATPTLSGAAETFDSGAAQFSQDAEQLGASVNRFSGAVELFAAAVAAAGAGQGVVNDA